MRYVSGCAGLETNRIHIARNLGYLNANPEAGLTRRTADQSGPERHPEGSGPLPDWDVFAMLRDWMLEALMSKCLEKVGGYIRWEHSWFDTTQGQIPFPWNPLFGDPFPMAQQQCKWRYLVWCK